MYVNKKGMLITNEKSTRRNPFHVSRQSHGSFLVLVRSSDDATEEQMRPMEPPSHAEINVSRSPEYEPALKNVRKQIELRIREILFADSDQDDVTELTDLADILPIKRDSGNQTDLDAFVKKPKKKHVEAKAVVTDGMAGAVKERKGTDMTNDTTNERDKKPRTPRESGAVWLDEIRMVSGSPDKMRVYGTLSGGSGGQSVNIVIRRASESKEYEENDGRLLIRDASGVFVGDGGAGDGAETAADVDILEDGRVLAVTAPLGTSGKRLRLDVVLKEPELVRCAYEVGVVPTS